MVSGRESCELLHERGKGKEGEASRSEVHLPYRHLY